MLFEHVTVYKGSKSVYHKPGQATIVTCMDAEHDDKKLSIMHLARSLEKERKVFSFDLGNFDDF
jgi:hypothetical protein